MTKASNFLLQLARWIAGPERAEWVDAMEVESGLSGTSSTGWAAGCLGAAFKDRLAREWTFVAATLLFPICAFILEMTLFFPLSSLFLRHLIPGWIMGASALLSPLPFAFLLGRLRPGRAAYSAAPVAFIIGTFAPLVEFWWKFGKSPLTWFGHDSTWYMMSPIAGLSCSLLVWLAGAWLGSLSAQAASNR
jgi:hypothetical protein